MVNFLRILSTISTISQKNKIRKNRKIVFFIRFRTLRNFLDQKIKTDLFERELSGRAPLNPLGPSHHYCVEGFNGGPSLGPHYSGRETLVSRQRMNFLFQSGFWNVYMVQGLDTQNYLTSKSNWIKPKSECIYHAPIDLEPNGHPFGSKSIGKW